VLYEMLCGRPPFEGDSPNVIAYKQVNEQPRSLREFSKAIPREVDALVQRCLQKRPEDRFQNAAELQAALRAAVEGRGSDEDTPMRSLGVATRKPRYRVRMPRPLRPSTYRSANLALVLVAAVAILFSIGSVVWATGGTSRSAGVPSPTSNFSGHNTQGRTKLDGLSANKLPSNGANTGIPSSSATPPSGLGSTPRGTTPPIPKTPPSILGSTQGDTNQQTTNPTPQVTSTSPAPLPVSVAAEPVTLSVPQLHYDGAVASVGTRILFAGGASYDFTSISGEVDIYDSASGQWATATLSEPRHALTSVTSGTKVFFVGGSNNSNEDSTRVDIYDDLTHEWSTAQLSQARHYISAVAVDGKVLFAGGWNASGITSTVDIYDLASNSWSTASLSSPTSGPYQAASVGNLALIANNDSVDIYNSQTGTWSNHRLSQARDFPAAVTLGTRVLFAGGMGDSGPSNVVDIYDSQTGEWQTASLSEPRQDIGPAAIGGKAYFLGGWTGSDSVATIDIYDNASGAWTTDTLPAAAWGVWPVVSSGKLFVVVVYGTFAWVYSPQ
jgi:hypothetical protein